MNVSLRRRLHSLADRADHRSHASRRSALAALSAGALLLGACVEPNAPGVQVMAVSADLVFGVPDQPPPPDTPPANSVVSLPPAQQVGPAPGQVPGEQPPGQAQPAQPGNELPPPAEPTKPPEKDLGPPLATGPVCESAPISEFPDEPAARNVAPDRRPAVGTYLWVQAGKRKGADTGNVEIPLDGFSDRQFRDVDKISDTRFSFVMEQTDVLDGAKVETEFTVRTDGASVSDDGLPVAPPGGILPDRSVGEPDRGIAITKITRTPRGGESSEFTPQTPLLMLPLPVKVGEQFTSTAVDPTSFQSIQYDAKVEKTQRVDACGEMVEGWLVKGTQTFSGATTSQRQFDVTFAPQLGAIPIAERIEENQAASSVKASFHIGQIKPDPLKKSGN